MISQFLGDASPLKLRPRLAAAYSLFSRDGRDNTCAQNCLWQYTADLNTTDLCTLLRRCEAAHNSTAKHTNRSPHKGIAGPEADHILQYLGTIIIRDWCRVSQQHLCSLTIASVASKSPERYSPVALRRPSFNSPIAPFSSR